MPWAISDSHAGPSSVPKDENEPYIKTARQMGQTTDLVDFFMTDSATADRTVPAFDRVIAYCSDEILERLRTGTSPVELKTVALVDDWTSDETEQDIVYKSFGPLTAQGLHDVLLQKVSNIIGPGNSRALRGEEIPRQPKSERVVNFITNPSCWSFGAIISTAPINQARGLRGMFGRYLGFESFIGEIPPPKKLSLFRLALDLPFYTIKITPWHARPKDTRDMGNKSALRTVTDLSFLSRSPRIESTTMFDYLCEAQMSLLITGTSDVKWMAHFFVDTYFEDGEYGESVDTFLHERTEYQGAVHYDPLTGGQSDAPIPKLAAREYFLIVAEARLRQYKDEWNILVHKLKKKIENYIQSCPLTGNNQQNPPETRSSLAIRNFRASILKAEEMLVRLAHKLETTIEWWKLCDTEAMFETVPARASVHLPEIEDHFKHLKMYLKDLESIRQMCVRYKGELAFQLSDEGHRDTKDQSKKLAFSQVTTLVMLGVISPVALAAAVLSMQPSALPRPLGANPRSFISLTAILMAMVWLSIAILMNWEYIQRKLKQLVFVEGESNQDVELAEF